ncbi:MAG: FHA domain-containing protein [Eubacteriales bacterium]|nr:FHA domain-containing protein [Eubacteriales bacterium]
MIMTVLACIAVLALFLFVFISSRRKEKEKEKEFKAAAMLLKEQQLQDLIDLSKKSKDIRNRLILVVSWKEEKGRKFVFDPMLGVRIGRDREENQICVPLETVSQKHCIIFSSNNEIYVQDLNSANGTYLKRGFKTFRVKNYEVCRENDQVIVGGVPFKVRSFWVDSAYL